MNPHPFIPRFLSAQVFLWCFLTAYGLLGNRVHAQSLPDSIHVLLAAEETDQALALFAKMEKGLDPRRDPETYLRNTLLLMEVYYEGYRDEEGLKALAQRRARLPMSVRDSEDYLRLLQWKARLLADSRDFDAARKMLDSADAFQREHQISSPQVEAMALHLQGLMAYRQGQRKVSMDQYRLALEQYQITEGVSPMDLGQIYYHLGDNFLEFRDYDQAVFNAERLVELMESRYGETHLQTALAYSFLAYIYTVMEENPLSLQYHHRYLNILTDLYGKEHPRMIMALNGLGNIYANLRDSVRSESCYVKSMELIVKEAGPQSFRLGAGYHNLGIHFFNFKDYPKARQNWTMAREIYSRQYGPSDYRPVQHTQYIGEAYLLEGRYEEAIRTFDEAMRQMQQGLEPPDPLALPRHLDSPDRDKLFRTMAFKGAALLGAYKSGTHASAYLDASVRYYDQALALVDSIRIGMTGTDSYLGVGELAFKHYEGAINAVWQKFLQTHEAAWLEAAFNWMERSRSQLLMSALQSNEAATYAGIPPSFLERQARIQTSLHEKEREWTERRKNGTGEFGEEEKALQAEMFGLRKELAELVDQIAVEHPEYYRLKYDLGVVSLEQLQAELAARDAILLEYFMGDSTLYIIGVGAREIHFHPIPIGEVQPLITHYQARLRPGEVYKNSAYADFSRDARALAEKIVDPMFPIMEEARHIIVVPDGPLGQIPFESLLYQDADPDGAFHNMPYLMQKWVVSYGNSGTLAIMRSGRRQREHLKVLAMAPTFGGGSGPGSGDRGRLQELPYARQEVRSIQEYLPALSLTGQLATESNFRGLESGYSILHLATHGFVDDENPMFSKLAFSEGDGDDGYLHTYELFEMQLNADLAVLSACNTGKGENYRGEGIMSLARGFMFAGCPSIVMSLWTVNDAGSAFLMQRFYAYLSQGLPIDEALALAKRSYLRIADLRQAHPYFWAGFVFMGDKDPIAMPVSREIGAPSTMLYLLGPALLLMVAMLVWLLRRRKRAGQAGSQMAS